MQPFVPELEIVYKWQISYNWLLFLTLWPTEETTNTKEFTLNFKKHSAYCD
jgi:hypothetical protein